MIDKCYRCDEVISMCPCDESTYTADDEISRLRAELAECRRDAERYRWIRGNVPSHSTRWSRWKVEYFYGASGWNDLRHAKLDAEIDAALAAKGE